MISVDTYTIITLLLAVSLTVMGLELALKNIPQGEQFAKLRMMKWLMASAYLLTAVFATVEFLIWDTFHRETAAFLNMASSAYQYVLLTAILTTCFNPAYTTTRRLIIWFAVTTAWALPLGILTFIGKPWAIYATAAAYFIQLTIGGTLFYRNFKEDLALIRATDTHHKFNSLWMQMGILYLYFSCLFMIVITWMPPVVHIVFTVLVIMLYIFFAVRFSVFAGRIFQDYYPVLTEAGLTDTRPEETVHYREREERCRKAVDAWVARKGFCEPDPDRDSAAEKIGLDKADLQWYFSVCLKEEFRAWRVKKRIREAEEILLSNPEAPINELAKALGFSSRGNFFVHFKKIMGETTQEFTARHHK